MSKSWWIWRRKNYLSKVVEENVTERPAESSESQEYNIQNNEVPVSEEIVNKKVIKNFVCDICNKTFSYRSGLTRHKNIHTKVNSYNCKLCNYEGTQSNDLNRHILAIHKKEKLLQCQYCGKSFSLNSILNQRIKTHTNTRNFICNVCNKDFITSSHLKTHLKIHSGKKLCKCNLCEKSFSEQFKLIRHMLSHKNKKKYSNKINLIFMFSLQF